MLNVYDELYGIYPYQELDVVQVNLGNGAGGVEFPQLVFIGTDYYNNSDVLLFFDWLIEFTNKRICLTCVPR